MLINLQVIKKKVVSASWILKERLPSHLSRVSYSYSQPQNLTEQRDDLILTNTVGKSGLRERKYISKPFLSNHILTLLSQRKIQANNQIVMFYSWVFIQHNYGYVESEFKESPKKHALHQNCLLTYSRNRTCSLCASLYSVSMHANSYCPHVSDIFCADPCCFVR